jgi:hypothetical protein
VVNGKAIASVRKGFEAAVRAAGRCRRDPAYSAAHLHDLADAKGRQPMGRGPLPRHDGAGHHHPDYQEEAVAALGGQYGARNSVNKQRQASANVTKIDAISKGDP